MKLKVIIYKNYGCVMWSVDDNGKSDINNRYNFYWSFYELNNGEKFSVQYSEDIVNGKITCGEDGTRTHDLLTASQAL